MDTSCVNDLLDKFNDVNVAEIPPWALLIIESVKVLINEFKGMKDVLNRLRILEDHKSISVNVTTLLQDDNKRLNETVKSLENRLDHQEQRSRNECLLIHGVIENVNELTNDLALNVINTELGLRDIAVESIQRSHRLGPKRNDKRNTRSSRPRAIIVRFTNYCDRNAVFRAKSRLKGKNISISENLTKSRYALYQAAIGKYGKGKVWTIEGRVTTKLNDKFITINGMDDLA